MAQQPASGVESQATKSPGGEPGRRDRLVYFGGGWPSRFHPIASSTVSTSGRKLIHMGLPSNEVFSGRSCRRHNARAASSRGSFSLFAMSDLTAFQRCSQAAFTFGQDIANFC